MKSNIQEKISPKDYKNILDGLDLVNIYLKSISANVEHDLLADELKIDIKDNATYETKKDHVFIKMKYLLRARNDQRKIVIKIDAEYQVIFYSKHQFYDDFFEIYQDISLPLNVWPFYRELVNSMTNRLNIPSLTLPLLKR